MSVPLPSVILEYLGRLPQTPAADELNVILRSLIDKASRKDRRIVLFGHFSAGKSSLINHLIGEDILPRNPIPTSARPVFIRRGAPGAAITFAGEENEHHIDLAEGRELFEQACRGELERDIRALELTWPAEGLPVNLTLVDTPGIDSTDPSHRRVTEELILQSDLAIYCADYKKVLSETNHQFLDFLRAFDLPVALVITQIDKHAERELPFARYIDEIGETLKSWGIEPEQLFPITVRERSPYWGRSENRLPELVSHTGQVPLPTLDLVESRLDSAAALYRNRRREERREEGIDDVDTQQIAEKRRALKSLEEEITRIKGGSDALFLTLKGGTERILSNNNGTENLVDAIADYAQSLQPKFRVGLLSTAGKVAHEQKRRQGVMLDILNDLFEREVAWIVRDDAEKLFKQYAVSSPKAFETLRSIRFHLAPQEVDKIVALQAFIDGGFAKILLRDLILAAKNHVREMVRQIHAPAGKELQERAVEEMPPLQERLAALQQEMALYAAVEEEEALLNELIATSHRFTAEVWATERPDEAAATLDTTSPLLQRRSGVASAAVSGENETEILADEPKTGGFSLATYQELRNETLALLTRTFPCCDQKGSLVEELRHQERKLAADRIVIAAFGAFSSGKTSLINAMLGGNLLPTSPHPTTATLGRIISTDGREAAELIYKKPEILAQEVAEAARECNIELAGNPLGEESAGRITKGLGRLGADRMRPAPRFLTTYLKGRDTSLERLGTTLAVDQATLRDAVASEQHALFLAETTLELPVPFLGSGIELVDTPGVGSINQRHSRLALDFMLKADALLYVTYYQHSFTEVDRLFLDELCRLRTHLDRDTVFFLLNAIDLAESRSEVGGVVKHVSDNLVDIGFAQPVIHPVSAECALHAGLALREPDAVEHLEALRHRAIDQGPKGEPDPQRNLQLSGLPRFTGVLEGFLSSRKATILVGTTIRLARAALSASQRFLEQEERLILNGPEELSATGAALEEAIAKAETALTEATTQLEQLGGSAIAKLGNEAEELIHYVQRRLVPRLAEQIKTAVVPLPLESLSSGERRQALYLAAKEMVPHLLVELEAELRITAARLAHALVGEWQQANRLGENAIAKLLTPVAAACGDQLTDFPPLFPQEEPEIAIVFRQQTDAWLAEVDSRFPQKVDLSGHPSVRVAARSVVSKALEEILGGHLHAERERILGFFVQVTEAALEQAVCTMRDETGETAGRYRTMIKEAQEKLSLSAEAREETLQRLQREKADLAALGAEWLAIATRLPEEKG